jgi:L-rhamnose mutarotase
MKNKLLDALNEFNIKNFSIFIKRNLLMVLLALFVCVGLGLSTYLGSIATDGENNWNVNITHVSSTSTPVLVPDTGWWSVVATPTSQPKR